MGLTGYRDQRAYPMPIHAIRIAFSAIDELIVSRAILGEN